MFTERQSRFAVATAAHIELPHVTSRAILWAIVVRSSDLSFEMPLMSLLALASGSYRFCGMKPKKWWKACTSIF